MRRGNDPSFWVEDGQVLGINLGADFTAEHEWGIARIRESLRIRNPEDDTVLGIDRRAVTQVPDKIIHRKVAGSAVLIMPKYDHTDHSSLNDKDLTGMELGLRPKQDLTAAWDESSFGIRVRGPENIGYLAEIVTHLMEKDACVFWAM